MSYEESGVDAPLNPNRPKSAIALPPSPSAAFDILVDQSYTQPRPEREIMSDIESSFSFSDTDYQGQHGRNLQEYFGIKQKKTFGPQNLPHRHKKRYGY